MAAPRMKAPNTAWMPTESVNQAPDASAASMVAIIHGATPPCPSAAASSRREQRTPHASTASST